MGTDLTGCRIINKEKVWDLVKEHESLEGPFITAIKNAIPGCEINQNKAEIYFTEYSDYIRYDCGKPMIDFKKPNNKQALKKSMRDKKYLNVTKFINKEILDKLPGYKYNKKYNIYIKDEVITSWYSTEDKTIELVIHAAAEQDTFKLFSVESTNVFNRINKIIDDLEI